MNNNIIIYILILIIFPSLIKSQSHIKFNYLGQKQGVSHITVNTIKQDSLGRIWIGTRNGLDMYEGKKIHSFREIKGDTTSILGYNILSICIENKNIWTLTENGISCLNQETSNCTQYPFISGKRICKYKEQIIIGARQGIFLIDTISKKVIPHPILNDLKKVEYFSIKNNTLWISTDKGLYKFNGKQYYQIFKENCSTSFIDTKNNLWVGTKNNGVFVLDSNNNIVHHFTASGKKHNSLINNTIRDIKEDTKENVWIGTFNGLSIININNFKISNYKQDNSNNCLSHNSIYSILRDKQGTMWLSTYFGGISYYNPNFDIYKVYPITGNKNSGLSYRVIGNITEDDKNNLWIATEGGGLNYLNRKTNTFTHFKKNKNKNSISSNTVKALLPINNDSMLIGTHNGGLNLMNTKTGSFKHYINNKKNTPKIVSSIIKLKKNKYLLASHIGISEFDIKKQSFNPFPNNKAQRDSIGDLIFCLYIDNEENLWIGTNNKGLFKYNIKTKSLKQYKSDSSSDKSISSNSVFCIFQDHMFRIWIGTLGGGLNLYNPKSDDFTNYQISNNLIFSIKESRYGDIWIAGDKGITRFVVNTNKFYNYNTSNGFPLNYLNENSLYIAKDGTVFIGGINGMVSFKESNLFKQDTTYNIFFSKLSVNNKQIKPNDNTKILKSELPYTKTIKLKPSQNIFEIFFTVTNYLNTNKLRYEYKLEGFNNSWETFNTGTPIRYTNLNPGSYKLKIRTISFIDNLEQNSAELNIIVLPPWYNNIWAYIVFVILIALLVFWLNSLYLSKVRLNDRILTEQQDKQRILELNKSKLKFFTNISHEFRTPLTLIMGILESLFDDIKPSSPLYKKIVSANKNVTRLNNLITELLDFRKLEQGYLQLKIAEYDTKIFIEDIFQAFNEYASHKNVKYSLNINIYSKSIWIDKTQMEKVFFNTISNAFKAINNTTDACISINVNEKNNIIEFEITDNGSGIAPENLDKIFDRFYSADNVKNKSVSSGIGLALCKGIVEEHKGSISAESKINKGSTFTICILKGNSHFSKKQLDAGLKTKNVDYTIESSKTNYNNPIIAELNANIKYQNQENQTHFETNNNKNTLLIVEDNNEMREMIKNIFTNSFNVIEANDGKEGLDIAINHSPDIIISDIMMPNLNGEQMCEKLKLNIKTSHIPIILLSARTTLEQQIKGIKLGADDYITKPFSSKLLKAKINNIINSRIILQKKFKEDPNVTTKELTNNKVDIDFINKANDIVEKYIDNTEFNVNIFAREMGYGKTTFHKKIKAITGLTANDFIVSYRLKKAAKIIQTNKQMNVSEIAYTVGFNTPRYFSQCFKDLFGITPSKYKSSINDKK